MSIARKKYDDYLERLRELAKVRNISFDEILRIAIKGPQKYNRLADLASPKAVESILIESGRVEFYEWLIDKLQTSTDSDIDKKLENMLREIRSKAGKHGADTRHSKPGGSRDKQKKIRSMWASGNYSSRDICAEQECAALDMSFSAARKALRNTPNPT